MRLDFNVYALVLSDFLSGGSIKVLRIGVLCFFRMVFFAYLPAPPN